MKYLLWWNIATVLINAFLLCITISLAKYIKDELRVQISKLDPIVEKTK